MNSIPPRPAARQGDASPPRMAEPAAFVLAGRDEADALHRILIVGGGAGGLQLAVRLGDSLGRRGQAEVLLVDDSLTHVWKPLLHEVAAGTLTRDDTEVEFLQQARRHHFRFHLGTMESLDRRRCEIVLEPLVDEDGAEIAPRRAIRYGTLVMAVGSIVNDFGTAGVMAHASRLDNEFDARRFHRRLLAAVARAELRGEGPVDMVIVGGGATGVELAAELTESVAELASFGIALRRLARPARLRLVELGPRLLAALDEALAERVQRELERLGVEVSLGQRVVEVAADHVVLAGGERLPAALTVWAAGIQGPPLLDDLDGLETNRVRQLVVRPTLQTTLDDNVFAMGDCASCVPAPGEPPVPPRAQAAHQEAAFLARTMGARLRGETLPDFRFRERGSLVSLGRHSAVGNVVGAFTGRSLRLQGSIGRLAYWSLYRQHLATLLGLYRTVLATIGSWFTARSHPRIKLH